MLQPGVRLICVYCSNCSKTRNLFPLLKIQVSSHQSELFFPRPYNLCVPNWWECLGTLTKHNISSLQTSSDSSEGLCHAATGVWEQRVIWPIRWGGDLGGQIGSVTVGCWPGHWGCHPWTSKRGMPRVPKWPQRGTRRRWAFDDKECFHFCTVLVYWSQRSQHERQLKNKNFLDY